MEKLRTKILALNVDFDGLSFDFLGSRKLRKKASKSDTPVKIVILPLLASLSWKRLKISMDMLPITTSTMTSFSVVSTSMILKDPELSK